jgi:hypothetical protein
MTDPSLCLNDATGLAALIREREVTPVEVVDAFLARIEALNPGINAFCVVAAEEARAGARTAEAALVAGAAVGPLHGVPVAFKDLTATAGGRYLDRLEKRDGEWRIALAPARRRLPVHHGRLRLRRLGRLPQGDAGHVRHLLRAAARPAGRAARGDAVGAAPPRTSEAREERADR